MAVVFISSEERTMKRMIIAGFSTLTLAALASPVVALSESHHDASYDGLGNKLNERFDEELYSGLGNKLNERFDEEFHTGLGNKMAGSIYESFYENHNGFGNQ